MWFDVAAPTDRPGIDGRSAGEIDSGVAGRRTSPGRVAQDLFGAMSHAYKETPVNHHPWTRRRLAGVAGAILAVGLLAGPLSTTAGASTAPEPSQGAPTVVCPATEGTPRFVRFIYLNILFRCPDTASMDYWVGRIDGGLSRSRFAELVDLSSENLTLNNVFPLYGDILGREPSIVELQAGVDSIRTHQADSRLIAELASSDEFFNALDPGMQDRGDFWLTTAYQSILDRDPDPAGFDFYRALMGTPSTATGRLKVARAMELSPENNGGWIFGVYFAGLNRPPDNAGFGYWSEWLTVTAPYRTFKMWTLVLSSDEGYARAQTQPNPDGPPEATALEGASNKIAAAGG